VIVPGHHDQDDVAYFQALWDTLSIPEPSPPALPSPPLAARAIRASLLSPGSLSALEAFRGRLATLPARRVHRF
jgi:hypothetical protein